MNLNIRVYKICLIQYPIYTILNHISHLVYYFSYFFRVSMSEKSRSHKYILPNGSISLIYVQGQDKN